MAIGLPFVAAFMPIVFFQVHPWDDFNLYLRNLVGSFGFTFFYWMGDRLIIAYFRGKMPKLSQYRARLIQQSFWILAYTLLFCNVTDAIEFLIGVDFSTPNKPSTFKLNAASITVTIAISAIYEAYYASAMWRRTAIESERLKKESMQAQLETLKNQVNPHFLFNSLNALTSMVHDQPDLAVEFVQKLSKVYRYILEIKDKEMIQLREEMECIHAYQFLLKMRFGDNVRFEIDIPDDQLDCHIVPLSLQILLENAIKHNIISNGKPLTISMSIAKNGNLLVSNNLQKKKMVNGSTKTGIENIRSRYRLLSGKEVDVIITQNHFSVSVPLIQVENYEVAHH